MNRFAIPFTLAMGLISSSAFAQTNLGFETGDTAGWTRVGASSNVSIVSSHYGTTYGTLYTPQEGSRFARLRAGCPGSPTQLYQSFHLEAGQTVHGTAAFDADDYLPFNDSMYVNVGMLDHTTNVFHDNVAEVGDYGDGAWTPWSFTAEESGTYTLVYSVENALDCVLSSYALFDGPNCVDSDADGLCDADDNCPMSANADQSDGDGDGAGNRCDPVCLTIQRGLSGAVEDAYISAGEGGNVTGAYEQLGTGLHSTGEKMSLIAFDTSAIPDDATVQSASLSVSMQYSSTEALVDVHAILAPWSEATVTYAGFDGAFDPAVEASFDAPAGSANHQACDVTDLVQSWVDGGLENNGLLLREAGPNKHSFRSSEHKTQSERPKLDLCYVTP